MIPTPQNFALQNFVNKSLWRYTTKVFLHHFGLITLILLSLILFFEAIELFRRAASFDNIGALRVFHMSLLKLPEITQTISPFIILFSALTTLWSLNTKNEITIFRLAGFSVWQFITPLILCAISIGFVLIALLNPIGTVFIKKFNTLENTYLSKDKNEIALFHNGLWLKQPSKTGYTIIHAQDLELPAWTLRDVMALSFDKNDQFLWRIDSPHAELIGGEWLFKKAQILFQNRETPYHETQNDGTIKLLTTLTSQKIEKSFSDTETMSFWQLPGFINTLESTGFDPATLKIYFHSMLSLPFFFATLILIAACVTLRPPRSQNAFKMISLGIGVGFILFFLSNFLKALGASNQIPIFIAAWFPVAITAFLGGGLLLSLEDG